jgi:hypothetical protein
MLAAGAASLNPPDQIHTAFAGRGADGYPTGLTFSYQTAAKATASARYGPSPNSLGAVVTGESSTYFETFDNHVTVTEPLQAGLWFYQVGSDADGWSPVMNVTVPKAMRDGNSSFSLFVYGDMGVTNSKDTMAYVNAHAEEVDFTWHIGDISYADDAFLRDPFKFGYESTWNEFMNEIQPLASSKAYMTLPGNHEAECHSGFCILEKSKREALANFTAYNHRFRMPSKESGGVENMWYSFNYGPLHLVSIDTETDFPNSPNDDYSSKNGGFGDQMAWLEADL